MRRFGGGGERAEPTITADQRHFWPRALNTNVFVHSDRYGGYRGGLLWNYTHIIDAPLAHINSLSLFFFFCYFFSKKEKTVLVCIMLRTLI